MSEPEKVMAVAFLFSLLASFAGFRERSESLGILRPALLGNVVLGALLVWPYAGISWRSFLFFLALGVGATEAGFWAGGGLHRVLPERSSDADSWGWSTDRWGCGAAVVIALALLIAFMSASAGDGAELE